MLLKVQSSTCNIKNACALTTPIKVGGAGPCRIISLRKWCGRFQHVKKESTVGKSRQTTKTHTEARQRALVPGDAEGKSCSPENNTESSPAIPGDSSMECC